MEKVPEPSARRLKAQYLQETRKLQHIHTDENALPTVNRLDTKPQGRPVLLGQILDKDYITALRTVGGVINTAIVMAATEGIIAARDRGLFVQYGGHIKITRSWAKSLLKRMGYIK